MRETFSRGLDIEVEMRNVLARRNLISYELLTKSDAVEVVLGIMRMEHIPDISKDLQRVHMLRKIRVDGGVSGGECTIRVRLPNGKGPDNISVLDFGLHKEGVERLFFDSVDELPTWIQERIALLSIGSAQESEHVDGIGYRAQSNIFWLEDNYHGNT